MYKMNLNEYFLAVRNGDKEAFAQIYDELEKPVFTIVSRIVQSKEIAEDVTQDIFVKLFVSPPDTDNHKLSLNRIDLDIVFVCVVDGISCSTSLSVVDCDDSRAAVYHPFISNLEDARMISFSDDFHQVRFCKNLSVQRLPLFRPTQLKAFIGNGTDQLEVFISFP